MDSRLILCLVTLLGVRIFFLIVGATSALWARYVIILKDFPWEV